MSKGKFTALATSVRSGFGGVVHRGNQHLLNGGGAHTLHLGVVPDATFRSMKKLCEIYGLMWNNIS